MHRHTRHMPSHEEFDRLAHTAYRDLPPEVKALCEDIVLRVEEFPSQEIRDHFGLHSPFELLGLYHGASRLDRSVLDPTHMPEMITLYRRPILNFWASQEDSLEAVIAHVLVHEIGHHFGFSDDDMEAIEEDDD